MKILFPSIMKEALIAYKKCNNGWSTRYYK